jgi:hypothetical protein
MCQKHCKNNIEPIFLAGGGQVKSKEKRQLWLGCDLFCDPFVGLSLLFVYLGAIRGPACY